MRIGIGLPNSVISLHDGDVLLDTARRAEAAGFASLATIGRVAYPTFEELVTLAAAAGATSRIQLVTDILLIATREPVLLAKQAATLDQVSGGRFVLGLGVGAREDDFTTSGFNFKDRGKRADKALDLMHRAWAGEPVGGSPKPITPRPVNGQSVPILIGGHAERAIARLMRYGIGFTQGGGTPQGLKEMIARVDALWREAGRGGQPEYRALGYFALGDDAQGPAEHALREYYGGFGDRVWQGTAKDEDTIRARLKDYEGVGADELIFFIAAPDAAQVDRLAKVVF